MDVIHAIDCDLTGYRLQVVEVAHNDRGTRRVRCRLFANDAPWTVPEGVAVAVSYTLPDGTPGLYAVPSAVVEGNTVTVGLSDQILGAAGAVEAAVVLGLDGNQLATFPFRIHVIGNHGLTNAATYPVLGAEFEGKLLFGGPGGRVEALTPGPGLEVVGNVLRLKVAGAGEGVSVSTDADGLLRVYLDGVEVPMEIDAEGYAYWPGLTASVGSDGYLMLERS